MTLHPSTINDQFGRQFTSLRLAVNERCNLRCVYCMSEDKIFPPDETLLSVQEQLRLISIVSTLGVYKIRLTGGEPLLHPHILSIVKGAADTPKIQSVHLTTNGVLLAKMAADLKASGLSGVNISLDSLDGDTFKRVTRRPFLERVMDGVDAALGVGFDTVKINAVAMRGTTEVELPKFVDLVMAHPITVRFIELMPFDDQQIWKTGQFLRSAHFSAMLRDQFPEFEHTSGGPTEHVAFQHPQGKGKIAFIPAYSRDICGRCNRFRITADGMLRNCLYAKQEVNLKSLLKADVADEVIAETIQNCMWHKPIDGWAAQRALPTDTTLRKSMSQIGG
ncbi:MAG: GTP 3',8-cyclase MoaA [Myxococcota bacterium]|nr:GTP 3',8-cyclase MoaA [Myxococcota bacterium]